MAGWITNSTWYPDEAAVAKKGIKVVHAELTTPIQISSNH